MADTAQATTDVVDLLKDDHEKAKQLLKQLKERSGQKRMSVLKELRKELLVHSDVEEEIVYPAYKEGVDTRDAKVEVAESLDEHRIAQETLEAMTGLDPGSIEFDAKLKLLKESVEHHIKEEERSMFPELREAVTDDRLRALAEEVRDRKKELEEEYA